MFPIFSIINEDLPKRKPSKVSGRDGLGIESRVRSTLMQVASWLQQTTRLLSCAIFLWLFQDHRTAAQVQQSVQLQQTDSLHSQAAAIVAKVIMYKTRCELSLLEQSIIGCVVFFFIFKIYILISKLNFIVFSHLCSATFQCVKTDTVQAPL